MSSGDLPLARAPVVGPRLAQQPVLVRYGAAVVVALGIAGVRAALNPLLGSQAPLLPFVIGIFLSAYLGGRGPALLTLLLMPIMATVWFTQFPHGTHAFEWGAHVVFFLVVGALALWTMEALQESMRQQALSLENAKAAAQKATASAAQLRLIADALPVLIAYVDHEHRFRFNNKGYQSWFFRPSGEVLGRHVHEILGEAAYDVVKQRLQAALAGEFVSFEAKIPYQSETRDVAAYCIPDVVFDGTVDGCILVIEDISERKLAEEAGRASEARLRLLADHLPVLVSYIDREETFRFANAIHQQWFGHDPAHPPKAMREVFGEALYAERLPHVRAALRGELVRFEGTTVHRHLGPRPCEITYVPERATDGTVRGFYVMTQDVTERRAAERALRESERLLKLIYDNASDGLYLLAVEPNSQFRILSVNESFLRMSGHAREQVEGRTLEEFLPRDSQDLSRTKVIEALEGRAALVYKDVAELPAGRRFAEVTLVPIGGAEGRITHLLTAWHDITAKQQAEDALREADRRKDEFLAMLAHELRNPLAPIRNVAHLLANEALDTATVRRSSQLLQRQASQLARLVDDLLDVARITRGAIQLKKETLALDRVLETALESVQPLFDVKRQTLRMKRSPEPAFVEGDPVRLCQIFANLLSNASKYSPDRTEVCLRVEVTADDAFVTVRDQGRGIDPQMLPHLFELFMQGDRSLDRAEGGLGIGLTIVKHLVEMHGGQIRADSAGLGEGSAFRVQLPRAFPAQSPQLSGLATRDPPSGGRRVLVVEDNVDAAESVALLLQTDGHTVEVAHDGAAALVLLERFVPEVILLDIGLPEMDGYLLAQTIRAKFPRLVARLCAMTGYGRAEDRSLAREAGFDDHLTKPVDPEQLLKLIATLPASVPTREL